MKPTTLLAVAVTAALAAPLAVLGQGAGGTTTAPSTTKPFGTPPAASPPAAAPGASAGATGDASAMFNRLDKNNDGQISRAEWDEHHRASSGATTGSRSPEPAGGTSSGDSAVRRDEPGLPKGN
jgi:hypothetical protein